MTDMTLEDFEYLDARLLAIEAEVELLINKVDRLEKEKVIG